MADDQKPKDDNINAPPRDEQGSKQASQGILEPPATKQEKEPTGTPTL